MTVGKKGRDSELKQHNFRLNRANEKALEELCRITGLSSSEVVRTAIMVFRATLASIPAPPPEDEP